MSADHRPSQPGFPALLVARADGTLLLRLELGQRRVVSIGRSPRCDLTLASPAVSRRHALLFRHAAGWRIVETRPRNGLEGPAGQVAAIDLDERSWCRIGSAHLWLDSGGAPGDDAPIPCAEAATQAVDASTDRLFDDPDREVGPVISLVDPGDRPLRRLALRERDGLLVGSSPTCDLVVPDPRVPPMQAIFYRERSRWCVADADGTASLIVDGRRTRRQRLHGGMLVLLGDHRLVVSGRVIRPTELEVGSSGRGERPAGWPVVEFGPDAPVPPRRSADPGGAAIAADGPVSAFLDPQGSGA